MNTPLPPVGVKKLVQEESGTTTPGDAMAGMDDVREEGEVREEREGDRAVNMDYEVGDYGWE